MDHLGSQFFYDFLQVIAQKLQLIPNVSDDFVSLVSFHHISKQQAASKPPVSLFPISTPKFRHPHRQEELELRWKFLFTVETITEVDAADTW